MGTLMLLITVFAGTGFGWGKPVPVDPRALRYDRFGMAIVSAAGPFSNLVLAIISFTSFWLVVPDPRDPGLLGIFLMNLTRLNIGLCAFNLLPVSPLDGFGVLIGILPWPLASRLAWLGQYGPPILLILVFSGSVIGISLLGIILRYPLSWLSTIVAETSQLLVSIAQIWPGAQ
jgi:Zn-dependent protease